MTDFPTFTYQTIPVTDALIDETSIHGNIPIMVQPWYRRNARHYVPRKDAGGWYVRTGKRGQIKEYLAATAEVTLWDGKPSLTVFRIDRPEPASAGAG
jgi:hypothetical protein